MDSYSVIFKKPVDYFEALEYQHRLLQARQNDEIPDMVVLLQHKSVITIGNRGRKNYLLKNLDEYKELGIDIYHVERGGDVTYHGPGQWVLYPIMKLGKKNVDSHGYLFNLEEIAIRVLSDFRIKGFRKKK
jgi:lipoyl(octanoyl) transferase